MFYIDGEGVTLEEFAGIMVPTLQSTQREPMEKLIKESFDVFDEDKNGFLSGVYFHIGPVHSETFNFNISLCTYACNYPSP